MDEEHRQGLAAAAHFAFGGTAGAVYGLLAPHLPLHPVLNGVAFGLGVWASSYLGWLPATGLYRSALDEPAGGDLSVLQAGSTSLVVAYPDEMLHDALNKLLRNDIGRLPVVSRDDPRQIAGYLSRGGILRARRHRIEEEHTREPGWLGRLRADSGR